MTLKEAMIYRGENESTLALMLATRPLDVRRWCKPGGLEKLSAQRLQQLAKALDGGVLITEDGAEFELLEEECEQGQIQNDPQADRKEAGGKVWRAGTRSTRGDHEDVVNPLKRRQEAWQTAKHRYAQQEVRR